MYSGPFFQFVRSNPPYVCAKCQSVSLFLTNQHGMCYNNTRKTTLVKKGSVVMYIFASAIINVRLTVLGILP